MIYSEETAENIARHLLEIHAIKLSPDQPFTWASGLHSPIYCDNRIALSFPVIRTYIRQQLVKAATDHFGQVEMISGVATAGIAQGVLVAQELGLPFSYVRDTKKRHGMANQIEGFIRKGQSAIVVEDLVSTGKSSLNAVAALRKAGIEVKGMLSIFTYGLGAADDAFEKVQCKLISLSDYDHLIQVALENNYVDREALFSLQNWRQDPKKWSIEHADDK
jgi:orotate phosphoribosyltransferase